MRDRCECHEFQDEKHMLFFCHDARVCALCIKYAPQRKKEKEKLRTQDTPEA